MAYCPVCAGSFPKGTRCPEHGALVVSLTATRVTEMEDGRPVNVATCYGDLMTRSWAELLLENGVPAMVKTGGPGFSLGGPPPFGFPSYIYVPSTHAARARDILKDFAERGQLEVNDDE